nr:type II toxin-antitoxin system RelE/ParE family toxin [Paraburkholderia bannensis]
MKTYELRFHKNAFKEWERLDATVRTHFSRKLAERMREPHVESAHLSNMRGCYKIKLVASGYRLIYHVIDRELVVLVLSISKREADAAYRKAHLRLT